MNVFFHSDVKVLCSIAHHASANEPLTLKLYYKKENKKANLLPDALYSLAQRFFVEFHRSCESGE